MNVLQKIEDMCMQKGWTVYKLALESGLSQSTLANMFARGTMPSLSTLSNICEAFGITLSQFFQEGESLSLLSPDEILLLEKYRLMPRDNKKMFIDLANKLV